MKIYNFRNLYRSKLVRAGIFSLMIGTPIIGCSYEETGIYESAKESVIATKEISTEESSIEVSIEETTMGTVSTPATELQTTVEAINEIKEVPEIPNQFNSPEELVIFIDEATTLVREKVDSNTLENDENMEKAFYILINSLRFRYLEKDFGGIYYSDLTEVQKERFNDRSSIFYSWLKMNVRNFSTVFDQFLEKVYEDDAELKEKEINQVIDKIKEKGNEFVSEQKEQWQIDKENAKEIIDLTDDIWQKQKKR